jgi:uncharacterized membrane protein
MIRTLLIAVALSPVGCGPMEDRAAVASNEQALGSAPPSMSLTIQWQGQQTGYWCGPASTRIALSSQISPPSQTELASFLGTTTNGTDTIAYVSNALNHYEGVSFWSHRAITDPPPQDQIDTLTNDVVGTISNGYAMVGNIISGWRPPGYPSGTIYHYIAIVGYDQGGGRAQIADPAGQCAAGSGWCNVPATYWVTMHDLAVWISGSTGYTLSGLPPTGGTPANGTLEGIIYENGSSSNVVSGAVVEVGGATLTTGADGLYKFDLAPGTYTATVTKTGYGTNSVSRDVTSGTAVWGSMEIDVLAPPTGTLAGLVYADSDTSSPLSGALVTANGKTATTDAAGTFSLTLSPGAATVTVTKAGFANGSAITTVTAGQTATVSVGLMPDTVPDTTPPMLVVTSPTGELADAATVVFAGTVTEVSTVSVVVNNAAPVDVPVAAGRWSREVALQPGVNTLAVSATDAAGNRAGTSVTVSFDSGVEGVVHADGDPTAVISAALVTITDTGTGAAQTATTDARGAFGFAARPGVVTLSVQASGFLAWRQQVAVPADQRLNLKIALTRGVDEGGQQAGPMTYQGGCSAAGGQALVILAAMLLRRGRITRPLHLRSPPSRGV